MRSNWRSVSSLERVEIRAIRWTFRLSIFVVSMNKVFLPIGMCLESKMLLKDKDKQKRKIRQKYSFARKHALV